MFYSLTGECTVVGVGFAVIDCGGVGYKCYTTMNTLRGVRQGEKTTLYTYLKVSEDALDIYGFSTLTELEYFKTLIGVSGVGAKSAVAILSDLTPERFASAVAMGDYKLLTKANGIGTKTAQRIVLELKDKMSAPILTSEAGADVPAQPVVNVALSEQAVEALQALGFSKTEASAAVAKCGGGATVEEIITKALKMR